MHKMVEYLICAAVVKAKAEISPEGCQELVAEYQRLNVEIAALRSELILAAAAFDAVNEKLSTARAEGKREGLEEAAKVAEARRGMVPGNTKAFRAYQDACQHMAAAIRAKIEETKL